MMPSACAVRERFRPWFMERAKTRCRSAWIRGMVKRILNSETGHNTIFDLALMGGEKTKAMIVDWQYEPIKGTSAAHRPEAHCAR